MRHLFYIAIILAQVGVIDAPVIRAPSSVTPPPSPVLQYKFNDGSGSTAVDNISANNLTLIAAPTWGTGPNGNGDIAFNGSSQFGNVGVNTGLNFERTNPFSITGWLKGVSSTSTGTVFGNLGFSSGFKGGYELEMTAGVFTVYLINDFTGLNYIQQTFTFTPTSGNWYFFCLTYDGSSTAAGLQLYVANLTGGDLTVTALTKPAATKDSLTASILTSQIPGVAYRRANSGSQPLACTMDDLRVYNVQLTQGNGNTIYAAGAQ